ncbi:MAG: SurA N-terminal domain-containing protein [Deltaproteobacteria bacterium]|nr:SurA N-terminal domain-containing protein [Deltaproteobacteria bacterium]
MLSFMRRNAGSMLIKIVLVGVALSFVVGFGTSYVFSSLSRAQGMPEHIIATVGDMPIGREDFLRQLEFVKQRYESMGMGENPDLFKSPFLCVR